VPEREDVCWPGGREDAEQDARLRLHACGMLFEPFESERSADSDRGGSIARPEGVNR
jgi:hypothetical protein